MVLEVGGGSVGGLNRKQERALAVSQYDRLFEKPPKIGVNEELYRVCE